VERRHHLLPIETLRKVPRVIGIAAGSNKVETIVAGARTGLLHLLITDEPTAAAALALIYGRSARLGRRAIVPSRTPGAGPGRFGENQRLRMKGYPVGAIDGRAARLSAVASAHSAPASSWPESSRSPRAYPARPTTWPRSRTGGGRPAAGRDIAACRGRASAVVVAAIVLMLATRRLRPLVAAVRVDSAGRGHRGLRPGRERSDRLRGDGSVLLAGIFCLTGGVSVLAAGLLAALVPE